MTPNLALFIPHGMEWVILVVVVVVLIFGAKKIPELAKSVGRATGEFQKGKAEADREIAELKGEREDEPTTEGEVRIKLVKAAQELGISSEGKNNEELREEIRKALAK